MSGFATTVAGVTYRSADIESADLTTDQRILLVAHLLDASHDSWLLLTQRERLAHLASIAADGLPDGPRERAKMLCAIATRLAHGWSHGQVIYGMSK